MGTMLTASGLKFENNCLRRRSEATQLLRRILLTALTPCPKHMS